MRERQQSTHRGEDTRGRREKVIQTIQDLQTSAKQKVLEGGLPEEENDPWKNVTTRARQKKRSVSGGEIKLWNRLSALRSKEEKQAEDAVAKKESQSHQKRDRGQSL
ncbi:unnamed protein product [Caretta caretta]